MFKILIQVFYYNQRMSVTLQCPGYHEDTLRSLADRLPCRETQVTSLLSLMGQVSEIPIQEVDISCSFCKSTKTIMHFYLALPIFRIIVERLVIENIDIEDLSLLWEKCFD